MKVQIALLLVALGATHVAGAEAPRSPARSEPNNIVLADVGLHVLGLGYQRTLHPRFALQVAAEYYDPWTYNDDRLGLSGAYRGDVTGAVMRLRGYVYLSRDAPRGWWMSPFAQAGVGWATRDRQTRYGVVGAVGVSLGYSFLLRRHVHIALGGGVQYHVGRIAGGRGAPSYGAFYPAIDASLGYAF